MLLMHIIGHHYLSRSLQIFIVLCPTYVKVSSSPMLFKFLGQYCLIAIYISLYHPSFFFVFLVKKNCSTEQERNLFVLKVQECLQMDLSGLLPGFSFPSDVPKAATASKNLRNSFSEILILEL